MHSIPPFDPFAFLPKIAGDWDKDDWTISAGLRFISF